MSHPPSVMPNRFGAIGLFALVLFAGGSRTARAVEESAFVPPPNLERGWYARIETERGEILARLLPEQAPQSVAHFAGLANATLEWADPATGEPRKAHYYDGIPIDLASAGHRFEAGGLDTLHDRVPPELYLPPDEGHGPVNFDRGSRLGFTKFIGNRVSGVKFFVTVAGQRHLSGQHPCFGTVIEGQEVVFDLSQVKTYSNGRPVAPVMIQRIRVFAVGDPDPLPAPMPYTPRLQRMEHRDASAD